jgi:hypothetical protein
MSFARPFALFLLLAALVLPGAAAAEDQVFGEALSEDAVKLTIDELLANPDKHVDQRIRVEGLVTGVCEKRGCWITVAGEKDFQEIRFKVKDGVMVFPMEIKGKRAVAEGIWVKFELTKEEVIARKQHQAEEHGEEFDPASVTEGETHYQIQGKGAVVK